MGALPAKEYHCRGAIVGRCQGRCLLVGVPTTPPGGGQVGASGGQEVGLVMAYCGPVEGRLWGAG